VADAEALGRSHYASWVESYSPLLPAEFWGTFRVEQRIEGWRRLLVEPPAGSRLVVALVDGDVVGHAMAGMARNGVGDAYPAVRDRELYSVYLLAEHQGAGLGRRLVDSVLDAHEPAQLWVFENNATAIRFYERLGFVPDGARHGFGPNLGNQAEIRMVR
jgi:ribosomal protein S18 acetylase RimI-like enzyme